MIRGAVSIPAAVAVVAVVVAAVELMRVANEQQERLYREAAARAAAAATWVLTSGCARGAGVWSQRGKERKWRWSRQIEEQLYRRKTHWRPVPWAPGPAESCKAPSSAKHRTHCSSIR